MRWTSPICATVDIDEEDAQTDHELHQGAKQAPEPVHLADSIKIVEINNVTLHLVSAISEE